jgi:hypothetical protein
VEFSTPKYVPCAVTWVYGDQYLGWYPYYDGYRGYNHGYEDGFDDGYWAGYSAASHYHDTKYNPGVTIINQNSFFNLNICNVPRAKRADWHKYMDYSVKNGCFFGRALGRNTPRDSRTWIEGRIGNLTDYGKDRTLAISAETSVLG